jgi:hypothetical protein
MIKKILRIPFLFILGYLAIVVTALYSILKWVKNGIIQELPEDEDIEMSEKYRKL